MIHHRWRRISHYLSRFEPLASRSTLCVRVATRRNASRHFQLLVMILRPLGLTRNKCIASIDYTALSFRQERNLVVVTNSERTRNGCYTYLRCSIDGAHRTSAEGRSRLPSLKGQRSERADSVGCGIASVSGNVCFLRIPALASHARLATSAHFYCQDRSSLTRA